MSAIGNWILGMQEDAFHFLTEYPDQQQALAAFLKKHPGEYRIFDRCKSEWDEYGEGANV